MIVFLNERSLETHTNWGAGLFLFWESANLLKGHAQLFRDSQFFAGTEFRQRFQSSLAGLAPDIRASLRALAFSDQHWPCWRPARASSDTEKYLCETVNVLMVDESLCEAAERKLLAEQDQVGMVSAPDSAVGRHVQLTVVKQQTLERSDLPNATSVGLVEKWIIEDRGFYDLNSTVAPADFQTVLQKDAVRFQRTSRLQRVGGRERRVYKEVLSGRLYYVDGGHCGHAAHLEVFDSDGKHMGEADIVTGIVDTSKQVAGRTISL